MKNKEIEELLNTFKELINTYSPDTEPFTIDYDYEIKYSALESLLSHIEQLEQCYCNRTDCIGRIKDSRKYDSVYQEKEDYKSRCEKAVEYIMVDYNDCKKLIDKDDITDLTDSYWQGVAITSRDLLNILQNGDDSE